MYSVDTSALLHGWVRQYPPDTFPALWTHLSELVDSGEFLISEPVLWDLEKKADEIYDWCKERENKIVETIDDLIQTHVTSLMAAYPKLVDTRTGKSSSDPFVIALAQMYDPMLTVVTEEKGGTQSKPKIPYVCQKESIRCISLLKLIQEQGWKF